MTEYQKYQLEWMIQNGHSLEELIDELDRCQMDWADHGEAVSIIFKAWENAIGFDGDLYLPEEEWQRRNISKQEYHGGIYEELGILGG